MHRFEVEKIYAKSGQPSNVWYSSFRLEDNFRKWAESVGMTNDQIDAHIRQSRGNGYDHLYASLQCIMKAHK